MKNRGTLALPDGGEIQLPGATDAIDALEGIDEAKSATG